METHPRVYRPLLGHDGHFLEYAVGIETYARDVFIDV